MNFKIPSIEEELKQSSENIAKEIIEGMQEHYKQFEHHESFSDISLMEKKLALDLAFLIQRIANHEAIIKNQQYWINRLLEINK